MAAENTMSAMRQPEPHLVRNVAGVVIPLLVFVVLLLITFAVTRNLSDQVSINAQLRFLNDTDRGLNEINARVRTYEDLLQNTRSLFLANPKLTRQQWQQYVNSLQLQQRYPGLASLGFAAYVPTAQQAAFVDATRADGAPNFVIHSSGTNPDLMVLKYVTVLPKSDAVLGWDMGADPAQRAAAESSRDTGKTTITPKLTLPQDTGGQSAFIMLVPVYLTDGTASTGGQTLAVADQRSNLLGWIYGGIHPDVAFQDLMSGVQSDLSFEVFDGRTTDQASLLWDSVEKREAKGTAPEKTDRKVLNVAGRDWTVGINSLPAFDALINNASSPTLLIAGSLASLLAAIALYALMNTQRNAQTLAERMTMALRESEERFRLITENAADLIAVVDRNNRRLYNSPSYQTILGYSPEELARTSALEQIHPDDRARVDELAAESLKTGVGRTIEYRMKHKEGGYRILESIATIIRDPRGQPENFVIVARDVTERKAQEAVLQRQNEYLAALQQTTLGLVSHLGLQDLLTNLIKSATELVGVKHGYIALTSADGKELETRVGVGVFGEHVGDKLKPGRELSGQVWQTGQPVTVEDYQASPDRMTGGGIGSLHAMAGFPLKTGNRVVGVITVARDRAGEPFSKNELDVLDQIAQLSSVALDNARLYDQLELAVQERTAELQTSEARYRTILENIEDGYYELDLTGDLTSFNDALVRITGYAREELPGLNYHKYTLPETAERLYQVFRHVFATGEAVRNVEFDIWRGETRTASVGVSVTLIRDREGKPTGFRGIMRDISEERRAAVTQNATLRISQLALTAPTLDDFYKGVHAIIGDVVPANNFFIAQQDAAQQALNFQYVVDEKDKLISQADRVVRFRHGLTEYALRMGKPLRLTIGEIEELHAKGEVDLVGLRPVEWMSIPLMRGAEPFGIMAVQSYDPQVRFSDLQRDDLAALARPLADAIDRKQAAEALVASEERNRLLVQSSPDPIVIYDMEGNATDMNAAFGETFGWTLTEMAAKQADFVPNENEAETTSALRDLAEHGRAVLIDTRRKTKDSRLLDVQLSASLLRGRDGLPIGNIVVMRDVTVRKRAEEAIRQQASYLGALQDTTVGLVSGLDVNSLLHDIVGRAARLVETEHGYVYLVEPGGEEMEMRVGTGLYDDLIGARTRPGVGLAGLVWQSSQPLVLDDYQKWPQRLPGARRDLLRAVVGVPLKSGDQTVGVIGLAYTEPNRKFGDNEMDVLSRFAQLAAVALGNAQLYQETQSRLDEVVALNKISQALTTRMGVRELSKLVIEGLRDILPEANAYLISLYDKRTNRVSIPYSLEGDVVQVVEPFPLGQGVSSYIIQNAKPVFINRDAETRVRDLGALTIGQPAQSFIGVPIVAGNEVIGTLSVQNVERSGLFDENDVRLMSTIASNLGVALRNAQLFEETRRAQTFLDSVVENLPFMVWVKDASEFRYVSVNQAFEEILGMTRGELLGKEASEIFPPDEAERFSAQDREVLVSSKLLDVPEEHVESRTNGTRILHTQKIPIYGPDGKPAYLLAIAEDITERKKAAEERSAFERKLLETQKLESLGVLAGGIAHDFNNLLVSILGNVGLALLDLEPASAAREPVEQIKVAAQRAADLTKQMLAYSGKGRFVMQRLNLNAVIEEMTQLLRVSISKNAMLRMNLAPNLPPIEADATQVRQIVMNLIVNASDAIGAKDGIITLNTGTVRADQRYLFDTFMAPDLEPGNYVFIEVADTGVGMDLETQKKMFEPFFTTKFTGRGLGLAAVLGIVRGHKGAIKVDSDQGRGTTFRILLPVIEGNAPMDESTKSGMVDRGHGIVLVVDDEDVVRNVTKRMLERFGYGVMMASDGREGVEVFRNSMDKISIVLLDMTMPHMNGEETFRELRLLRPEIKVLLMSGYTEQEATSRFAGKGLAGFLQKPYTPQELHEKIQSIVNGK